MGEITLNNGKKFSGDPGDLLNFLNLATPSISEWIVAFIGEDGFPCPPSERVAIGFMPLEDNEPLGYDSIAEIRVNQLTSGRWKLQTRAGANLASIPNESRRTFADANDFLKAWFENGHLWPLQDEGWTEGGFWRLSIPYLLNQDGTLIEGLDALVVEDSGALGDFFRFSFLNEGAEIPLFDDRVSTSEYSYYREGTNLVLNVLFVPSDFTPPVFRVDGDLNQNARNWISANGNSEFVGIVGVNGWQYERQNSGIISAYLIPGNVRPSSIWNPDKNKTTTLFE